MPPSQLFETAYAAKRRALVEGRPPPVFWERLVFSKLRQRLGGKVRFMSTGSAPISAEVSTSRYYFPTSLSLSLFSLSLITRSVTRQRSSCCVKAHRASIAYPLCINCCS